MTIVYPETTFKWFKDKRPKKGYYLHPDLKSNIDNYFIRAVEKKWDCVILVTGMEGSAKSTNAMSIARYIDPTFPGKRWTDEEWQKWCERRVSESGKKETKGKFWNRVRQSNRGWRHCDRIVFTFDQFIKAIDTAKPKQAIVFDEAVTTMNAQDAAAEFQKTLIKKMTMIRKKRLFIFIIIPNIFMLRRYFAVARARALIHFYTPDGIDRGYFKFYNYEDKRKLYFDGWKDWSMKVAPSFKGNAVDTAGFFFNMDEYEDKKDNAIEELTAAPEKAKKELSKGRQRIKNDRDKSIFYIYHQVENLWRKKHPDTKFTMSEYVKWCEHNLGFDYTDDSMYKIYSEGRKLLTQNETIGDQSQSKGKGDYMLDDSGTKENKL